MKKTEHRTVIPAQKIEPKPSKTDVADAVRLKNLHELQHALLVRYRRKQPDPSGMPQHKLLDEWNLLSTLAGTSFMTVPIHNRWVKVSREYSARAAGTSQF